MQQKSSDSPYTQALGLSNTLTIQRAWEDSWDDIPQCDLVIASRSTAVMFHRNRITSIS